MIRYRQEWRWTWLALTMASGVAGCASPVPVAYHAAPRHADAPGGMNDKTQADQSIKSAAVRKATSPPQTSEEALTGVLDELQRIGAIDPQAQQELMADLKNAKPEHYALIVEQFKSALAYRQQLASRKAQPEKPSESVLTDDAAQAVVQASEPTPQPHEATANQLRKPPTPRTAPVQVAEHTLTVAAAEDRTLPASSAHQIERPLTSTAAKLTPVSYVEAESRKSGDWQHEVGIAIEQLQAVVKAEPNSVAEVQDHMRLRTLQLLAGRHEEAYRPIPGTSPAQQDYWSKQLFSMSAYLDGSPTLDDKRRAAAALLHLDEARAALSELATLQVRNLAFVKSVDGFGVYEPRKSSQFKAGEQAALYAEVENFRSVAGDDGYRTSLATSYQVLDKSGHRVEGGQFPEITDLCRSRRRDFHMQYGIVLPKQVYAGDYSLEIVITDQESGKIGRASLPFEIVGD